MRVDGDLLRIWLLNRRPVASVAQPQVAWVASLARRRGLLGWILQATVGARLLWLLVTQASMGALLLWL
jgi:hypothetical protein